MDIQAGTLYLVSTPIGNLEDITLRALSVLKQVDLVAAEDTRHTRELLAHFDIHTRLVSCHAFNEHARVGELLEELRQGRSIAAVSDAGTPSIADPGYCLARAAIEAGFEPVVIPGVSALTFAATASGLPVDKFAFYAFPPIKSGRQKMFFDRIAAEDKTVFFYESVHRIAKTLKEIADWIGPETQVVLIREATKLHEEIRRGTAAELAANPGVLKGEFVIGIGKERSGNAPEEDSE